MKVVESKGMSPLYKWLIVLAVLVLIWLLPVPEGVTVEAWRLLAIFAATILGLILQPVPMGAVVLLGLTMTVLTGVRTIGEALSGFSNGVVWLIVMAFLLARGFIKTGLGRRIAFLLIRAFGKTTLGLGYALVASDLIIAPATPSNTARAGGVLYPIVRSLSAGYDSEPGPSARKIGSYLMMTEFQGTCITSAMFMTAMAGNTLIVTLAGDAFNIQLTWGSWALAALVPGLLSLALIPYLLYKIYPPEIKTSPEAPIMAAEELRSMGPIKTAEMIMLLVFVTVVGLWATSQFHSINATTIAILGVSLLLATGVLEWQDVLSEKGAWDALIWFGGLVMMAGALNSLGLITWFSEQVSGSVAGWSWTAALLIIILVYVYSHYGFASLTAHITAMFVPFAAVAIAAGAPPYLAVLSLAFFSNLNASITHYGTGPAPIYFGSGYIDMGTWWKIGFVVSVANIIIWLGAGSLWWKVIGLW
jgi:divalent anion:Na+ symporter, DASS family